jgi:hypothetical protein
MDRNLKLTRRKIHKEKVGSMAFSNACAYGIAALLSAPFTVMGTALQLSIIPNIGVYGSPEKAIALVEMAKSKELAVKEMRYNTLQLASG